MNGYLLPFVLFVAITLESFGWLPSFMDSQKVEGYADRVVVDKSDRKLYLMRNGRVLAEYHIALGRNPDGAKVRQGDRKTPEGEYILDFKKVNSDFYRAIHVSYPSKKDIERARRLGVKPGGAIMIHGQPNGWGWLSFIRQRFNWTSGCIAVSNDDMDEIWKTVRPGTPITIRR